jgi:2,4-dienoyl-CoA reductase-like NADH-dependent reductase (Old Yellow Enzyme family)
VRAIKEKCGEEYPLIFCITVQNDRRGTRYSRDRENAQELVKGRADVIHVSCGMPVSDQYSCAPMDVEDCFNVENAAIVKRAVDVPVIAVDRIVTVEEAEEVLQSGQADLVAMARALLADPELVNKYMGITKSLPACAGCDQGCATTSAIRPSAACKIPYWPRSHAALTESRCAQSEKDTDRRCRTGGLKRLRTRTPRR